MLSYPHIDPIIFRIGPLAVRWYGLMYLLGFIAAYFIIQALAKRRGLQLDRDGLSDLLFYAALGVILGGRLGYTLFYKFPYYMRHPLEIFAIWEGGMSFHGGLLGVIIAVIIFCRKRNLSILLTGDILVTAATVGLGFGRIGNFINGELWGRVTDVPWGMVFPHAGPYPRHPSQLYESFLEGVVLFIILWMLHKKNPPKGVPLFTFVFFYGIFRFFVEFFRQPDAHLGFLWGGATMGQLLSLPMIFIGMTGIVYAYKKRDPHDGG